MRKMKTTLQSFTLCDSQVSGASALILLQFNYLFHIGRMRGRLRKGGGGADVAMSNVFGKVLNALKILPEVCHCCKYCLLFISFTALCVPKASKP